MPAAIDANGLALRARPFESIAAPCFPPGDQATSRPTTTDEKWGQIRPGTRSQRYELTEPGRRTAVFFTKTYVRILNPALAELDPHLPAQIANQSDLAQAWRAFERALDQRIKQAAITA